MKHSIKNYSSEKLRKSPSEKYQHVFNEITFGDNFVAIADIYGYSINDPLDANIEYRELRESLIDRMLELFKIHLTEKQINIFELILQGQTQDQIAEKLDKNQGQINHMLNGQKIDGVWHGGIYRKLRKMANKDEKIQEILKKIQDIMD